MHLQLGRRSVDVTSRTLTLISIGARDDATSFKCGPGHTPDIIELLVADADTATHRVNSLRSSFAGSIAVRTSSADVADVCLSSGADIAHDPDGFGDPDYLRVIEEAGATAMVSCSRDVSHADQFLVERARWALAAGLAPNKIVVSTAVPDHVATLSGAAVVMFDGGHGTRAAGANAVAVMNGARIIACSLGDDDVRATRRVAATISELIERREPTESESGAR